MRERYSHVSRAITLLLSLALLTSCGGSSNGGDKPINFILPDIDAAFLGSRDPILLDEFNTLLFARLIYGSSATSDGLQLRESSSDSGELTNIISLVSSQKQIVSSGNESTDSIKARSVSGSEACTYGGSRTFNGNVDDETGRYEVIYQLTNCQENDGEVMNGEIYSTEISDSETISEIVSMNELSITQGGNTFFQTGTLTTTRNTVVSNRFRTEAIHLLMRNGSSDEQIFIDNLQITSSEAVSTPYPITPANVSGKIYLADQGYVTISPSEDLVLDHYSWEMLPEYGYILLTGASESQARISPPSYNYNDRAGKYRLDLDKDGDGAFEFTAIQDVTAANNPTLTENQAPTSTIRAYKRDQTLYLPEYQDHPEVYRGDTVYLVGSESEDPEYDTLTYKWTIETAPEGSTAVIVDHPDQGYVSRSVFQPDTVTTGIYKISLKVTDETGSGESSISFFDFDTSNRLPTISLSDAYSGEGTFSDRNASGDLIPLEAGYFYGTYVEIVDVDVAYESPTEDLRYTFEFSEKPIGSNSQLEESWNGLAASGLNFTGYGVERAGALFFTPDMAGVYKVRVTATDHLNATTTKVKSFTVINNPPTLSLECESWSCTNGNEITVGNTFYFTSSGSYDRNTGFDDHDFNLHDYEWTVNSEAISPSGVPFETITSDRDYYTFAFTPEFPGQYTVTLTAKDPSGLIGTVEKTFYSIPQ